MGEFTILKSDLGLGYAKFKTPNRKSKIVHVKFICPKALQ